MVMEETRWGAVSPDSEWSIPTIRAEFLRFGSKTVEHSRYLLTRTLTRAGYARFRDFLLYGERGLAGKKTLINIFQDTLALEYGEHPLAKYSVEWQPDDKHFLRVGNPRLYDHPYQSPQVDLWPQGQVEWFVIIQAAPYGPRPRRKRKGRIIVMQPPLLKEAE
jgi:hypothetical protein